MWSQALSWLQETIPNHKGLWVHWDSCCCIGLMLMHSVIFSSKSWLNSFLGNILGSLGGCWGFHSAAKQPQQPAEFEEDEGKREVLFIYFTFWTVMLLCWPWLMSQAQTTICRTTVPMVHWYTDTNAHTQIQYTQTHTPPTKELWGVNTCMYKYTQMQTNRH